jgi:hypothetical protein
MYHCIKQVNRNKNYSLFFNFLTEDEDLKDAQLRKISLLIEKVSHQYFFFSFQGGHSKSF